MPPPLDLLTPNEIYEYVDRLCADLAAAGRPDAARRLQDVQKQVFTTGAEWRGEMRLAARAIRRQQRLPRDLDARVSRLLESDYADRVARWQLWRAGFHACVILTVVGAVVGLVTLADGSDSWASLAIAALFVLVALTGLTARLVSACPGCGARSERLGQIWCPFCGMRRDSGMPGPRRRSQQGGRASTLTTCPACAHAPGGRSRYGRNLPSEGWFCGHCGEALPDGDPGVPTEGA